MNKDILKENIVTPGMYIEEYLEVYNMSQLELAQKLGLNKKTVNEIIQGKAPVTPTTAQKLEYIFGLKAYLWNRFEQEYEEKIEKIKDMESIEEDKKILDKFPYNDLSKRNIELLPPTRNKEERVINIRRFLSEYQLTNIKDNKIIYYRKKDNDNLSYMSLLCWLRIGEVKTMEIDLPKFNINLLKRNVLQIRKLTNKTFLSQLEEIKNILRQCGVSLVYEPLLPKTYINGASYKLTPHKALIMISDKGKRDDILWFTLFHEIAHLIKHSTKIKFIDDDNTEKNEVEKEADEYAKNILIPNKEYENLLLCNDYLTKKIIIDFCKKNNINTGILIGRLQKDNILNWNEFNNMINYI